MSQETSSKAVSPVASLFQSAHAKMALLQRVEEQYSKLSTQRQELQEELRSLQSEINSELNRLIEPSEEMASSSKSSKRMQVAA